MQNEVNDRPCILIERPRWCDAEILRPMVARRGRSSSDSSTRPPKISSVDDEILVLEAIYHIDLGIIASNILRKLLDGAFQRDDQARRRDRRRSYTF
jgi:hypothetical protein